VIRSNAQRTEAKLAWFSHEDLTQFGLPVAEALFLGIDKCRMRISPWRHRAPDPEACRAPSRSCAPSSTCARSHAGLMSRGAVLCGKRRAGAVATRTPAVVPLRRHHAGEGRRLEAKIAGLRLWSGSAHRSVVIMLVTDGSRCLLAHGIATATRCSPRSPASSNPVRISSTPCAARCSRRPASRWVRSSSTRASRGPSPTPHAGLHRPGRDDRPCDRHHRDRRGAMVHPPGRALMLERRHPDRLDRAGQASPSPTH